MRIGIVMHLLRHGGGTYQLLNLAKCLEKHGHKVIIYTYYMPDQTIDPVLLDGLKIKSAGVNYSDSQFNLPSPIGWVKQLGELVLITWTLWKLMKEDNLDLVNPHEYPASWAGALVTKSQGIPSVWMCNDVWHIGGEEEGPEMRRFFRWGKKWCLDPLDRWLVNQLTKITVLDHRIAKIVEKRYRRKAQVVRSGIDLNKFIQLPTKREARRGLHIKEQSFQYLMVSIYHPHRRFEDAIRALARFPLKCPVDLLIVGSANYDPGYAKEIELLVNDLKLAGRVKRVTHYISREELIGYLVAADVLIFPNERQTWGLIAIEAMAAGKPVIVSNETGVHEIIRERYNGLVFKARNVPDLYREMQWLYNHPVQAKQIGRRARKEVLKRYSWERYALEMEQVFNNSGQPSI